MSTALVFVSVAIFLVGAFAFLALRHRSPLPNLDQALHALRSLDIEAFRNLLDPNEEMYLREHLRSREFRRVKRARARAALSYLRELSNVSLQFARFGSAAQRSPDAEIAASGKRIANGAIYLRLLVLQAGMQMAMAAAFPGQSPRSLRGLAEQYDRAARLLVRHNVLVRVAKRAA